MGDVGEPEDVAALVRFLLGPEASWITGENISVDGGHAVRRGHLRGVGLGLPAVAPPRGHRLGLAHREEGLELVPRLVADAQDPDPVDGPLR